MSMHSSVENTAGTAVDTQPVSPYAWYVLALLTATYALGALDRSIVAVLMEPIREEFKVSDSQLGFLIGLAFGGPNALAAIPLGILIDRVNRRNLLAGVLGLWSILTALCGFAQNFVQLMIARMAVGAGESAIPAAHSIVTDYFPAEKRPMAIGFLLSGGMISYLIIFAIGGWVAHEWGWRYAFFVVGLPGLLVAVLIFLTVKEPKRGAVEKVQTDTEVAPSFMETVRYLCGLKSFVHFFIGYALISCTVSGFWGWVGSLLIRIHGLPVQEAGFYIAAFAGIGGLAGNLACAVIAGKVGQRGVRAVMTLIAGGAAAILPFGAAMSLSPTFTMALVAMPVVAALANCLFGPLIGVMLTLAKVRMRGVSSSFLYVCGTLVGMGGGPLIVGTISQALGGGNAVRYGLAALFFLNTWAAIHFWIGRRSLDADIARAASN